MVNMVVLVVHDKLFDEGLGVDHIQCEELLMLTFEAHVILSLYSGH